MHLTRPCVCWPLRYCPRLPVSSLVFGGKHVDMTSGKSRLRRLRQNSVVWLCALFVASRTVVFLYFAGKNSDLIVHLGYVKQLVAGRVPFRDFFPEYPPLAVLFTCIPALLNRSLTHYFKLFRALCCAIDIGIFATALKLDRGRLARSLLYILSTTALGPLVYDRIDIALGALLLVALTSLAGGRWRTHCLAVGAAIAFKIIPIVWVAPILGMKLRSRPRQVGGAILLLAIPTIVSCDLFATFGGYRYSALLNYHLNRGIQIESTPAVVELTAMHFGLHGTVYYEYGSFNVHTRYEHALTVVSTLAVFCTVLAGTLIVLRCAVDARSMPLLLSAILATTVFVGKVLSPQYFIFLAPLVIVVPAARGQVGAAIEWLLVFSVSVLTGIIFPWDYDSLRAGHAQAVAILMLRNGLFGILCGSLFLRAWKSVSDATKGSVARPQFQGGAARVEP